MEVVENFLECGLINGRKTSEILRLHFKAAVSFIRDAWLLVTAAQENPSFDSIKRQLLITFNFINDDDRLFSFIFIFAFTLAFSICVTMTIIYLLSPRKKSPVTNLEDLEPRGAADSSSHIAIDKVDRSQHRESSKARMESFASEQAKKIAAPITPTSPSRATPGEAAAAHRASGGGAISRQLVPTTPSNDRDSNDFDTWSVQSGVTSEYLEADKFGEEEFRVSRSPASAPSSVLDRSLLDPGALSGLRVAVAGHGVGIVLGFERKKFRSTRFRVLFDDGKVKLLKLKRSAKKGVVPFTLLEASPPITPDNTAEGATGGNKDSSKLPQKSHL